MKEFSKIDQLNKEDYYYAKEGYIIFTEKYHLKRGYCCNNNCKRQFQTIANNSCKQQL